MLHVLPATTLCTLQVQGGLSKKSLASSLLVPLLRKPTPCPAAAEPAPGWPDPEPTKVNGKIPSDFSEEGSVSSGKRGRERFGQGYDFTVCVHRMSPFPHGGTLATLPTFLVLSVQHCTWSYLPFTRELI